MGIGIIVCGLNGVGKSTIGKALAKRLNYHFIDNEDLYFPKTDANYIYSNVRTQDEAEKLLLSEIKEHENFVFAAVKGECEKALPFFKYAVLIEAPREIRLQRVKERSFRKFGDRMLPNGDLYDQEQSFFNFVSSRAENTVEKWIRLFGGQVIRVDGTKPIDENIDFIMRELQCTTVTKIFQSS